MHKTLNYMDYNNILLPIATIFDLTIMARIIILYWRICMHELLTACQYNQDYQNLRVATNFESTPVCYYGIDHTPHYRP